MGEQSECTNWSAIEKMIVAARPWFEEKRTFLDRVLRESNARLSPLCDPLTVDLGSHRWLREEREAAYSDWLDWVIRQLPSCESLFFLFDIRQTGEQSAGTEIEVKREEPFRAPSGQTRYIDMLVSCSKKPALIIEVKKRDAWDEPQKLKDYCDWAVEHLIPHRILLGASVQEMEGQPACGFVLCGWEDLCIRLRRLSALICETRGTLVAAMVLAFVGAVEQNLLHFTAPTTKAGGVFSHDWPLIAAHIQRS
jgi:hypothetical protein